MSFISFSCLIVVARISSTMLNKSDENWLPSCVPELRAFRGWCDVSCRFVTYGIYYVEVYFLCIYQVSFPS